MVGGAVHVINFAGSLNQATSDGLRNICLQALHQEAREIRLNLACEGGSSFHGFALYGFLRALPVPLVTHNLGSIESMGLIVYLAGQKRLVSPHGRFLIRPLSLRAPATPEIDLGALRVHHDSLDDDLERLAKIFDQQTQGGRECLDVRQHLAGPEKRLAGPAAVTYGVAHAIEEASLPRDAVRWWVDAPS